jgi:hypothetical protein
MVLYEVELQKYLIAESQKVVKVLMQEHTGGMRENMAIIGLFFLQKQTQGMYKKTFKNVDYYCIN